MNPDAFIKTIIRLSELTDNERNRVKFIIDTLLGNEVKGLFMTKCILLTELADVCSKLNEKDK